VPGSEDRRRVDPTLAKALERLDTLVRSYEAEPDPAIRERAFALLQSVDAVHRAGLRRLAALLDEAGGALQEQALGDPAVRLLLEMYDLLPTEAPGRSVGFVALEDVEVIPAPRRSWLTAAKLAELPRAGLLPRVLGDTRVLLARVGEQVYAYHNGCGTSPLSIDLGRRDGDIVVCPWHGCRYDLASGKRVDQSGEGLIALPVKVVDDEVRVELPTPPDRQDRNLERHNLHRLPSTNKAI
jgi:nitrite reductase/ring-hydroxylating ferredoxin subunit